MTPDERRLSLVSLRTRLRLRQLDVAKACGVDRARLSLWESAFAELSPETVNKIEDYLSAQLVEHLDDLQAALGKDEQDRLLHSTPLSALGRPPVVN